MISYLMKSMNTVEIFMGLKVGKGALPLISLLHASTVCEGIGFEVLQT